MLLHLNYIRHCFTHDFVEHEHSYTFKNIILQVAHTIICIESNVNNVLNYINDLCHCMRMTWLYFKIYHALQSFISKTKEVHSKSMYKYEM